MGCGESRIRRISLTTETDWGVTREGLGGACSGEQVDVLDRVEVLDKTEVLDQDMDVWAGLESSGSLPNSLLEASIPNSDLGESLDCRPPAPPPRMEEDGLSLSFRDPSSSFRDQSSSFRDPSSSFRDPSSSFRDPSSSFRDPSSSFRDPSTSFRSQRVDPSSCLRGQAPTSASSLDSGDSGYEEYEGENQHIITEHSSRDLVDRVVNDFRPAELPELLVITGRACTRITSGYQQARQEEQTILANLREEGLLAKPGGKAQGGLSFEIIDIKAAGQDLDQSFKSTCSLLPEKKLSRLEQRREQVKKVEGDLEDKLAEADIRRKNMEAERIKKLTELSSGDKIEKQREELIVRETSKQEQAMMVRRKQLETMRSKLREKSKKVEMLKLKKSLNSSHTESDFFDD